LIQADAWEKRAAAGDIYEMTAFPEHPIISQDTANQCVKEHLIAQGHRLIKTQFGFRCDNCKISRATKNFRFWESNLCRPRPSAHRIVESKRRKPDSAAELSPVQVTSASNFVPDPSADHVSGDHEGEPCEAFPDDISEHCSADLAAPSAPIQATAVPDRAVRHDLDDAEGDSLEEDDHFTVDEDEDHFIEEEHYIEDEDASHTSFAEASLPHSAGRIGKRLLCKTRPKLTAYADIIPLGSRLAAQTRKRKVRQANLSFRQSDTAARKRASIAVAGIVGSITDGFDDNGNPAETAFDDTFADAIDSSHSIKAVNSTSDAVFCHRCGAYSDGGPLRLLRSTCTGVVAPCRRYWHAILLSGNVPGPGVRLPTSSKRTL
jgi:hypothetical protein